MDFLAKFANMVWDGPNPYRDEFLHEQEFFGSLCGLPPLKRVFIFRR